MWVIYRGWSWPGEKFPLSSNYCQDEEWMELYFYSHYMIYDMIYDIFVNCNWVVTRWQ